jgi:hypothetical protein
MIWCTQLRKARGQKLAKDRLGRLPVTLFRRQLGVDSARPVEMAPELSPCRLGGSVQSGDGGIIVISSKTVSGHANESVPIRPGGSGHMSQARAIPATCGRRRGGQVVRLLATAREERYRIRPDRQPRCRPGTSVQLIDRWALQPVLTDPDQPNSAVTSQIVDVPLR